MIVLLLLAPPTLGGYCGQGGETEEGERGVPEIEGGKRKGKKEEIKVIVVCSSDQQKHCTMCNENNEIKCLPHILASLQSVGLFWWCMNSYTMHVLVHVYILSGAAARRRRRVEVVVAGVVVGRDAGVEAGRGGGVAVERGGEAVVGTEVGVVGVEIGGGVTGVVVVIGVAAERGRGIARGRGGVVAAAVGESND